jgi:hypothetical protein
VQGLPVQKHETLSEKQTKKNGLGTLPKWKHLPSKCYALSSIPSTTKKKKKKKKPNQKKKKKKKIF